MTRVRIRAAACEDIRDARAWYEDDDDRISVMRVLHQAWNPRIAPC